VGRGAERLADGAHDHASRDNACQDAPRGAAGGPVSARAAGFFVAGALGMATAVHATTVDEVVAQNIAARGGLKAIQAVRTLRMTGHAYEGPGREAIVRREIARPGRIRTEFEFQGTTGIYVWNGDRGWKVSPLDGSLEAEPMTGDAAALSAEQADFDGPLVDWKAKGHKVELVGTDSLPGGPAHHLQVTLKSGVVRQLWIDAASGQLVKSMSTRTLRGHKLDFEVLYSDYQETGGVKIARSIVAGVVNRPRRLRIAVEKVEMNPKLDEAAFREPKK